MFPKINTKELLPEDYHCYLCSAKEIKTSHTRCYSLKVPVNIDKLRVILPEPVLAPRLAKHLPFITAAEGIIDPICRTSKEYTFILSDAELMTLKTFAAPVTLTAAAKAGIIPGAVFSEKSCGTNALALAKEHQRLVTVRGEQHYCQIFKEWWCVAGPVRNPTGHISGYLDISMPASRELGLAVALLKTLITAIEKELLLLNFEQTAASALPPVLHPQIKQLLTTREQQVLELLLQGFTSTEIATTLSLSVSTVSTHRKNIYKSLDVNGLRGLVSKFTNR